MILRRDGRKVVMPKGAPRRKGMKAQRPAIATSGGATEPLIWLRRR